MGKVINIDEYIGVDRLERAKRIICNDTEAALEYQKQFITEMLKYEVDDSDTIEDE